MSTMGFFHLAVLTSLLMWSNISTATSNPRRRIESIEVKGTSRLSADDLTSAIRVRTGDSIDDESMMELRARLLGLGLFKDAIFSMQKGSSRDSARLTIMVVDDNSVVGNSALGAEFGLIATDHHGAVDDSSPFRSYHLGFIARNLFSNRHRAAVTADMDVKGTLAAGYAAYGLPRFAPEAVQFDAVVSVVDPEYRYLEARAFGQKILSQWTQSYKYGDLQYGAAWYSNTHRRYRLEPWPEVVAGPRVGFVHDTRFLGFMPSEGWKSALTVMPSLVRRSEFVSEAQLGGTLIPMRHLAVSADLHSVTVGQTGVTTRGELRLDVPITDRNFEGTKAVLFTGVRQGYDRFKDTAISGSDAMFGIRYYSTAFIGELTFQITKNRPFKDTKPPPRPTSDDRDVGL